RVGSQDDDAVAVADGEEHALALDAAKGRRLKVRDDDDLRPDERRGVVARADAGDDLPLLAAELDLQHEQAVGLRMGFGRDDARHPEVDLLEVFDRDHERVPPFSLFLPFSRASIAASAFTSRPERSAL